MVIKIASVEEVRQIEAAADSNGLSYAAMMENAGQAVAERALDILGDLSQPKVTILVGGGNNGGDGLVAGTYIAKNSDAEVRFYLLKSRDDNSDDNFAAVLEANLFVAHAEDDRDQRVLRNMIASADLVLDALFGIGVKVPIKGNAEKLLRTAKQTLQIVRTQHPDENLIFPARPDDSRKIPRPRIIAVDCPSGLDCDTGEIDPNTIHADETITFIAMKPGLLRFPGAASTGNLSVAKIRIPEDLPELARLRDQMADGRMIKNILPPRPVNGHKGTYGKVLVIAGSVNYPGAAGLSAEAAYRAGAGVVTVGAPAPVITALAAKLREPTWLVLPQDMGVLSEHAASLIRKEAAKSDSLLIGPGLGTESTTGNLLYQLLQSEKDTPSKDKGRGIGFVSSKIGKAQNSEPEDLQLPPCVIDADGLNLLAKRDKWWELLPPETIITPHPGEMSRLSGISTQEIAGDLWNIARTHAKKWNVILVLKGAHTIITSPDDEFVVLPFKTDALSTAGTGDILAGLIAGMRGQKLSAFDAAVAGSYVHGLAGELATKQFGSGRGIIAGDVLAQVRSVFRRFGVE